MCLPRPVALVNHCPRGPSGVASHVPGAATCLERPPLASAPPQPRLIEPHGTTPYPGGSLHLPTVYRMKNELSILLLSVGNTRTAIARAADGGLARVERLPNTDLNAVAKAVDSLLDDDGGPEPLILVASVNRAVSEPLIERITRERSVCIQRLGTELPIPIGTCLDPGAQPGQDRLLNAAAAFDRFHQACVVIDAGTAITVDFIDGEGTFHGGAIAPGAQMQLDAMHAATAALPVVKLAAPSPEPFGANTTQAMLHGVFYGIRGMVRHLTEQYALAYAAYPMVIATGGDAHLLFDEDELIEHVIDELGLHGMLAAHRFAQTTSDDCED